MFQGIDIALRKPVPFHQSLRYVLHLLGHLLVGSHLVLQPVALLLISESRHEIIVIREIVITVERRHIFETLHKHSLLSQRIVIERTVYLGHALLPRPVLGSADEKSRHLNVIHGIEPAETRPLLAVIFIVPRIDHGADTARDFLSIKYHPHPVGAIPCSGHSRQ